MDTEQEIQALREREQQLLLEVEQASGINMLLRILTGGGG